MAVYHLGRKRGVIYIAVLNINKITAWVRFCSIFARLKIKNKGVDQNLVIIVADRLFLRAVSAINVVAG